MKRVLSFSLYGDNPKYTRGMIRNAELAKVIYPGWEVRVWVDRQTVPESVTKQLTELGCVINSPETDMPCPPMMKRFLVADDPTVERFCVRDADSRLSQREKAAVNEWISSDTILHVMRDHWAHQTIPGGMWGGMWRRDNWEAPPIRLLVEQFLGKNDPEKHNDYGFDQSFLFECIWKWTKVSSTQHDSDERRRMLYGQSAKPFPTEKIGNQFVGEVFEFDQLGHEYPRECDLVNKSPK